MASLDRVIAVRNAKTVYRNGGKCIKVFNKASVDAVLEEALRHSVVEQLGLPVPKFLEVTKIDGKWAITYEYIEGKTLAQLLSSNPELQDEMMEHFVALQAQIHSFSDSRLPSVINYMKRRISEAPLDKSLQKSLCDRLNSFNVESTLCHGDFNPSNVIAASDGKFYIIDWAHCASGAAPADVSATYLNFCIFSQPETAEKYLDLYCHSTGISREQVRMWLPPVAASRYYKANQSERAILYSWIRGEA